MKRKIKKCSELLCTKRAGDSPNKCNLHGGDAQIERIEQEQNNELVEIFKLYY